MCLCVARFDQRYQLRGCHKGNLDLYTTTTADTTGMLEYILRPQFPIDLHFVVEIFLKIFFFKKYFFLFLIMIIPVLRLVVSVSTGNPIQAEVLKVNFPQNLPRESMCVHTPELLPWAESGQLDKHRTQLPAS